jgi:two-component system, LytTR family, sensor kinase
LKKTHWFITILSWQVIGFIVSLIISLPTMNFHHFVHELLICLTFTNIVGIGASLLYILYSKWLKDSQFQKYAQATIIVTGLFIAGGIASKISLSIGNYICGFDHFEVNRWHLAIIILNFIVLAVIAVISFLLMLYEKLSANLKKKIIENEKLQRLQIESKLALLQSKINPHFLFNTLNTILDTVKRDPDQTEKIILNLSDIYRKTLTMPDNSLVPLKEELKLVEEYLEIEKVRMGERLQYSFSVEDQLINIKVPPMILQILVENSIKHGLSPKKNGGSIFIEILKKADKIILKVIDSGVGISNNRNSDGFGLFSIQQRLQLMYKNAKIEIEKLQEGGTQVEVLIPYAN